MVSAFGSETIPFGFDFIMADPFSTARAYHGTVSRSGSAASPFNERTSSRSVSRSRVPLRMSFAGGGTDVPPYPQTHGGGVLCAAIDRFAYASLEPAGVDTPFVAESLDFGISAAYAHPSRLAFDGEHDLLKASLRRMAPSAICGAHLSIHSDAPPGSGPGSSSAMTVAIVGALARWLDQPLTDYETAQLAVVIEREDVAIAGGLRDQYACTFGGGQLHRVSSRRRRGEHPAREPRKVARIAVHAAAGMNRRDSPIRRHPREADET